MDGVPWSNGTIPSLSAVTVVSVIVANQISGPVLCKLGLTDAGESLVARNKQKRMNTDGREDMIGERHNISGDTNLIIKRDIVDKHVHFDEDLSQMNEICILGKSKICLSHHI